MKLFLILSALSFLLLSNSECNKNKIAPEKLKGQLEIKGICLNYTIRLLDGNIDTSKISNEWTNPNTGKTYKKVFGLTDPCSFPENIKEGETFYFIIDTSAINDCIVCEAWYPTPSHSLKIKVIEN